MPSCAAGTLCNVPAIDIPEILCSECGLGTHLACSGTTDETIKCIKCCKPQKVLKILKKASLPPSTGKHSEVCSKKTLELMKLHRVPHQLPVQLPQYNIQDATIPQLDEWEASHLRNASHLQIPSRGKSSILWKGFMLVGSSHPDPLIRGRACCNFCGVTLKLKSGTGLLLSHLPYCKSSHGRSFMLYYQVNHPKKGRVKRESTEKAHARHSQRHAIGYSDVLPFRKFHDKWKASPPKKQRKSGSILDYEMFHRMESREYSHLSKEQTRNLLCSAKAVYLADACRPFSDIEKDSFDKLLVVASVCCDKHKQDYETPPARSIQHSVSA